MSPSAKPCRENALLERTVKRRPHGEQRQRCPPRRVCPSRRVLPLPHRTHALATPFTITDCLAYRAQSDATKPESLAASRAADESHSGRGGWPLRAVRGVAYAPGQIE